MLGLVVTTFSLYFWTLLLLLVSITLLFKLIYLSSPDCFIVGNSLSVSIKDSGKGIKKELIEKIFQPGYTTKQIGIGTGLGLAISEKIIEKHNGELTLISNSENGCEFQINLK